MASLGWYQQHHHQEYKIEMREESWTNVKILIENISAGIVIINVQVNSFMFHVLSVVVKSTANVQVNSICSLKMPPHAFTLSVFNYSEANKFK